MTRPLLRTPSARAAALLLAGGLLALAAPLARAQTPAGQAELLQELKALRERVEALESRLKAAEARPADTGKPQWGMTPEQVQEFNRIAVKTEGLEDAIEAQGLKQFKFNGFMDPTYLVNHAQRSAGFRFLNNFSGPDELYAYDNSYFGLLGLDLQKEMEGGVRWRFTLVPHKSAGANYNFPSMVHEATISVPITDLQTRFWAGQLPDWSGYEYFLPHQNKFITHNMLFDYAAPTYYTGAGLDITRGKWMLKLALGNMNASRHGAERQAPILAYRVDYSRGEFQGFGFAGQHGRAGSLVTGQAERLHMFEFDAYFIRGDWTWQGQWAIGQQAHSASNGELARWWGLSSLLAYKVAPRFELSARLDYLNNRANGGGTLNAVSGTDAAGNPVADGANGIGWGMGYNDTSGLWEPLDPNRGVNRWALALGMNYLVTLNTTWKFETRFDGADQPVFYDVPSGSWRRRNWVLGTSVVVSF